MREGKDDRGKFVRDCMGRPYIVFSSVKALTNAKRAYFILNTFGDECFQENFSEDLAPDVQAIANRVCVAIDHGKEIQYRLGRHDPAHGGVAPEGGDELHRLAHAIRDIPFLADILRGGPMPYLQLWTGTKGQLTEANFPLANLFIDPGAPLDLRVLLRNLETCARLVSNNNRFRGLTADLQNAVQDDVHNIKDQSGGKDMMVESVSRLLRQWHSQLMQFSPRDLEGHDIDISDGGTEYFRAEACNIIRDSWTEANLNFTQQQAARKLGGRSKDQDQDPDSKPPKTEKIQKLTNNPLASATRSICFKRLCHVAGVKEFTPTGATVAVKLKDCIGTSRGGKLIKCRLDHEDEWKRHWTKALTKASIEKFRSEIFLFTNPAHVGLAEVILNAVDSLPTTVLP